MIPNKFDQKETLKVAERLAQLIDKDTEKITERDKVDFWIMKNPKEALARVTKEEQEKLKGKDDELYKLQRERVTEQDLASLTADDLEVLAIYRELTSGYAMTQQMIKNEDVSLEEFARVSENLPMLPGIDTTTDWERKYAYDETLRSILGGVTDGLPLEKLDYYMSRGYSRNDRVGKVILSFNMKMYCGAKKKRLKM